jgi:lipopolysaccharide export system protein LptA
MNSLLSLALMGLVVPMLGASLQTEASVRLGVAPFEVEAGAKPEASQLATRLARELDDQSPQRVVAPEQFGVQANSDPRSRELRQWAEGADVDAVVVGRVSQSEAPAAGFELAVEVRSGHSGGALSAYRVAVAPGAGGARALETLASSILEGLGYQVGKLPDVGAPTAKTSETVAEEDSGDGLGISNLSGDEPIFIRSEELEVIQRDDGRTVIFDHNVMVVQGDIELQADHLEALYAKGESQPDELRAEGSVRVSQGERLASCDRAVYLRGPQTVMCIGHAELTQDCDIVRGEKIRFDLEREGVKVIGAAAVEMKPDCKGSGK